jgi:hypothetical protein
MVQARPGKPEQKGLGGTAQAEALSSNPSTAKKIKRMKMYNKYYFSFFLGGRRADALLLELFPSPNIFQ